MKPKLSIIPVAAVVLSIILAVHFAETKEDGSFSPYVDKDGQITRPTDFKEKWTYLGSWVHPNSEKDGMHNEPGRLLSAKQTRDKSQAFIHWPLVASTTQK